MYNKLNRYDLLSRELDLLKVANDQHEQMQVLVYLTVFLFAFAVLF